MGNDRMANSARNWAGRMNIGRKRGDTDLQSSVTTNLLGEPIPMPGHPFFSLEKLLLMYEHVNCGQPLFPGKKD